MRSFVLLVKTYTALGLAYSCFVSAAQATTHLDRADFVSLANTAQLPDRSVNHNID